ncbi:MAG: hypothetical protein H6581_16695 [Bacteroidia bacterium]|nr:hypothetical protein [Bacteroidia bacterium]
MKICLIAISLWFTFSVGYCQVNRLIIDDSLLYSGDYDPFIEMHFTKVMWMNSAPFLIHPTTNEIRSFSSEKNTGLSPQKKLTNLPHHGFYVELPKEFELRKIERNGGFWYLFTNKIYAFDTTGDLQGTTKLQGTSFTPNLLNGPDPWKYYNQQMISLDEGIGICPMNNYWTLARSSLHPEKAKNLGKLRIFKIVKTNQRKNGKINAATSGWIRGVPEKYLETPEALCLSQSFAALNLNEKRIFVSFALVGELFEYDYEGNLLATHNIPNQADTPESSMMAGKLTYPAQMVRNWHLSHTTYSRIFSGEKAGTIYRIRENPWEADSLQFYESKYGFMGFDPLRSKPSEIEVIDLKSQKVMVEFSVPFGYYVNHIHNDKAYLRKIGDNAEKRIGLYVSRSLVEH